MCRYSLPGWQRLHTELGDALRVVSVAVDVQGPEVVRPWVTDSGVTFPTVVDVTDVMARVFGLAVVPVAFFVGPDRRLVEPPTSANPDDDGHRRQILDWARGDRDRPGFDRDARRSDGDRPQVAAARAWWRLASLALAEGRAGDARAHLEQAFELDPTNWLVRKQRWALDEPGKFYNGTIDTGWQKEQVAGGR